MANKKIKGLTVEIGGDTTKLGKALDNSQKKTKSLQSELKQVDKLLKMDPKNVELLAQKQKILTEQVEETKKRLSLLRDEQGKVNEMYQNGEIGEAEYRKFQREIEKTKQDLAGFEKQLKTTGDEFAEVQRKSGAVTFKNAEDKVEHFKGKVKDMTKEALKDAEKLAKGFDKVGDGLEKAGSVLNKGSAAASAALVGSAKFAMDFEDAMAKVSTIADENEVPMDKLKQQILDLSNETGVAATDVAENVYNAISAGQKTADAVNFVANSLSLSKAGFADTGAALDVLTTIMNAYGMSAEEVSNISDMLIQTQNLGKVTVGELASSMGKVIPTANSYGVQMDQLAAAYSITTAKGIAAAESTTYINSMLNELGKSGTKSSDILKEKMGKSFKELMADGYSLSDVLQIVAGSAADGVNYFNAISSTIQDATGKSYEELQEQGYSLGQIMELINEKNGDNQRSFNALNEALKNGTGKSFKQLKEEGYNLTEILNLVDERTEGSVKSFNDMWGSAEAAKAATTLLGDSAQVFNDRLKEMNGSTGATNTALGKLKTTSSETKKIVNALKNAGIDLGEEVLKQAAPLLEEVMGGVKNVTEWLKKLTPEEKKTLTEAIKIVAVAGPAVTIGGKLTKGIGNIVGLLPKMIKSIQGTTLAQQGLNAAMDANPIGAVALAITAFIAVVGGGIAAINAFHDAQLENAGFKAQIENLDASINKLNELKGGMKETSDALKDSMNAATNEMGVIDNYKTRLDELLSKASLTDAEQADLVTIADYFSKKYPEFEATWNDYIHVDENGKVQITGDIEVLKEKLDDLIDSYKRVAAQAALTQLAQENAVAVVQSRTQVRDSAVEYTKALDEYNAFIKEWDLSNENAEKLAAAQPWFEWENVDKSKKVLAGDLLNQYNELTQKMGDAQKSYNEVTESAAQLRVNGDDLARMQAVVNGNFDDAAAVMMTYGEGLITVSDIENSQWKTLDNLATKAREASEETGENLVFGLNKGVRKYQGDISEQGIKSAELFLESTDIAYGIKSPSKEMYKRGVYVVQGFVNGIRDGMKTVWDVAQNLGSTALNAVKSFLGIASPSKEAAKLGRFTAEGFAEGIESGGEQTRRSAEELAEWARNALGDKISLLDDYMPYSLPQSQILTEYNVTHTHDFKQSAELKAMRNDIRDLNARMDALAKRPINLYLDGRTFVGSTIQETDRQLGELAFKRDMGV